MEPEKTTVGKCPLCGSDVIKTLKGYACVNSLNEGQTCQFFLFPTIGNRRLSDSEAVQFLAEGRILLDGFATKEGKAFTSVLSFNPDGTVGMSSQIGNCPKCGGTLYIGPKAVSCSNFRHPERPCNFTIWRSTCGHDLTLREIGQIVTAGATEEAVDCHDNRGNKSMHRIGLNAEKEVVRM